MERNHRVLGNTVEWYPVSHTPALFAPTRIFYLPNQVYIIPILSVHYQTISCFYYKSSTIFATEF